MGHTKDSEQTEKIEIAVSENELINEEIIDQVVTISELEKHSSYSHFVPTGI